MLTRPPKTDPFGMLEFGQIAPTSTIKDLRLLAVSPFFFGLAFWVAFENICHF
jgi:hypothetical protein